MESHVQFIQAQPGWLALFEEENGDEVEIHAEPVIAWCLGADEPEIGHHVVSYGQAVIGAGPWLEKADTESSTHFFALVREEQLDPELLEELAGKSHHSREDLIAGAIKNREERAQGHHSWVHDRRSQRMTKKPPSPTRIL